MNPSPFQIILLLISLGGALGVAHGHGYVSDPPSRNVLCRDGKNINCGAIQYEPQSLEAPSGFPSSGGPADGRIASASQSAFSALDEQTSSRWVHQAMQPGIHNFNWTFTANHVTRNWRYFITRQDWNPNQPLTRASFESLPFCTVDGAMQKPSMMVTHSCSVPTRSGYQIILAIWEIGDTVNSFYNLIDTDFKSENASPTPWEERGKIIPSINLEANDIVRTRVFDPFTERSDLATTLEIKDAKEGLANTWALNLANKINREQIVLKAGQKSISGEIFPVAGENLVFAQNGSDVQRVELQFEKLTPVSPSIDVKGLNGTYSIVEGVSDIPFTITSNKNLDVSVAIYDAAQRMVMSSTQILTKGNETPVSIRINPATAGSYTLVVIGKETSGAIAQMSRPLVLEATKSDARYDYLFPQGLSHYKAGIRVLQPLNGRIYECRPWPYSGYCSQWSASANQFEPGVGFAWKQAWISR